MRPALVSLIALIGLFKMTLGRTSCATLARVCDWRGNRFAHAARLAAFLGGAIILTGCAVRPPVLPPAPIVLHLPDCPEPLTPLLPGIDGVLPLDSPGNVEVLLERDDILRAFVSGLRATIGCYGGKP